MGLLDNIVAALRALLGNSSRDTMEDRLDHVASKAPEKLDWRNSIVDLMKLVDMDSGLEARKKLAQELGYQGNLDGSAEMNTWLHERVMSRLR